MKEAKWADSARGWLSAHLYFNGSLYGKEGDDLITQLAVPFAESCLMRGIADRYFFVRYYDPGPHIRLRLRGKIEAVTADLRVLADTIGENAYLTGVRPVPYEPETERYGGPDLVETSELLFFRSSQVVAKLLTTFKSSDDDARRGRAAAAAVVLLHVLCRRSSLAAKLLEHYASSYLGMLPASNDIRETVTDAFQDAYSRQERRLQTSVHNLWGCCIEGAELGDVLDEFRASTIDVRNEFEARVRNLSSDGEDIENALNRILWNSAIPSHLHMLNNRLGITRPDEAFLATALARCLRAMSS